tara:strand:- start:1939 stop:2802 length:864 start_codon:yes stop_codon:yes gene_type:complete
LINWLRKKTSLLKNKKTIYLIDSDKDKDFVIFYLEKEKILGLDTEFVWRTTYYPVLSLLQISSADKIFLIDCIKCKKLDYLKELLEDKNKLVIFHSSRSDTTVLHTNLNIKIENIYDIQIAEKNISNGDVQNYAAIVKKYFYTNLKKTETNSNWLKRPFSKEQLSYAADDVNYLIEIYIEQIKALKKSMKLNKTFEESKKESILGNQDLHLSRINKLKKPSKMEKTIFMWREDYAKELNIPTSYIFKNKDLKKLSLLCEVKELDNRKILNIFKKSLFAEDFIDSFKN